MADSLVDKILANGLGHVFNYYYIGSPLFLNREVLLISKSLFAGNVPANNTLFAATVLENNTLFAGTVLEGWANTSQMCWVANKVLYGREKIVTV